LWLLRVGEEITREAKKARKVGGLTGSSSDDSGSESVSDNDESDYESSKNMSSGDDDDFNPFRDESSEDNEDGELFHWRLAMLVGNWAVVWDLLSFLAAKVTQWDPVSKTYKKENLFWALEILLSGHTVLAENLSSFSSIYFWGLQLQEHLISKDTCTNLHIDAYEYLWLKIWQSLKT
jgi:hypothetical protein